MPTLEWMGKSKVVAYHRQVPYRVLERIPEKSVLDSHGSDCGNMIIHGDNLEALKALHRSALQHRQRGMGLQRQRERSANQEMARRSGRQRGRGLLTP